MAVNVNKIASTIGKADHYSQTGSTGWGTMDCAWERVLVALCR